MTKAEKLALLEEWKRTIEASEASIAPVIDVLMIPPETPFVDGVHALQCDYTRLVAKTLQDESGMLDWFWLENKMGAEKMRGCPKDCAPRPIETLEDLLWVIEGE